MDENNLHHEDDQADTVVVEKKRTIKDVERMISKHTASWKRRGGWARILWAFFNRKTSRILLYSRDNKNGQGFDLNVRVDVYNQSSVHSKMVLLAMKWIMDDFIRLASAHDPQTLRFINSLPFLTEEERK